MQLVKYCIVYVLYLKANRPSEASFSYNAWCWLFRFFDLFEKYGGYEFGHLKLKHPKQLQEVLDIARYLLSEVNTQHDPEIEEKKPKLEQLKAVLEM